MDNIISTVRSCRGRISMGGIDLRIAAGMIALAFCAAVVFISYFHIPPSWIHMAIYVGFVVAAACCISLLQSYSPWGSAIAFDDHAIYVNVLPAREAFALAELIDFSCMLTDHSKSGRYWYTSAQIHLVSRKGTSRTISMAFRRGTDRAGALKRLCDAAERAIRKG